MKSKKKILVITPTYTMPSYPAKGLYVKEQALCLINGGICDIELIFIDRKSKPFLTCLKVFLQRLLLRSVSLKQIDDRPVCYYIVFPINRRIPDFLLLGIEKQYLKLIKKAYLRKANAPDLLHAHTGLPTGHFAHELSKDFDCPFVITEHSPLMFHFVSKSRGEKVIEAFERSNYVASLTNFQDQILKRHSSEINSIIIPNRVDENVFYINPKISKDDCFTIISVLYSNPVKGSKYLFECFKNLMNSNFNFKYIIVGEGIETMKSDCKKLGVFELGEFYFNLNNVELARLYNRSNLFVSSSLYETFGLAAREAMLSGIPVLTTDNGGIVDSINENTGRIVPVKDSKALADSIWKIYENYNNYQPELIRKHIINECGTETFRQKMSHFYSIE
ncbi:glycosyltransferase [Echinicola salinicaeni]|uniref:glycosyltransferase n=1 Tax=Echinicola salinicaeni TaxID=2762757 RepID=UPI0016483F21|nr:glycosyltransferase [Echinicola salinicaeni]